MKNTLLKSVWLVLFCCGAALTANAQGIKVVKKDGNVVYYKASDVESVGVYGYGEEPDPDPHPGEHEWVDLGLPSGTLWATMNVGANSPEEPGKYFAWGETQPKDDYSRLEYKFDQAKSYFNVTKYCTTSTDGIVDNKKELEPEDDAATANWGSDWQMPTVAQLQELLDDEYTIIECTTLNDKKGIKVKSKSNGNEIFLPAVGYCDSFMTKEKGEKGYYWSRMVDSNYSTYAISMYFGSSYSSINGVRREHLRYRGLSVRAVRVKKQVSLLKKK